jgi:hypothetical protein
MFAQDDSVGLPLFFNLMKKSLPAIIALLSCFLADSVSDVVGSEKKLMLGRSYVCHFGKYGEVTIDTRDPDASITIGGIRYPAKGGSYFYQTDDGKLTVAFNPKMTTWTYLSEANPNGIADDHCKVSFIKN